MLAQARKPGFHTVSAESGPSTARLTSATYGNSAACPHQGLRGHLAEGLAVVVRELAKVPEAVRQRDGLHQWCRPRERPQCRSNHHQPTQLQESMWADGEDGPEGLGHAGWGSSEDV